MNILGQSLTFNQTSNIGNQRFGEEVKLGTTDNSDVSLIANNVEFLTLDADSGELKLGDNITFTSGESSKIPKYGWLGQVDNAVLSTGDANHHNINYDFTPNSITLIRFEFKLIELTGSASIQFGIRGGEDHQRQNTAVLGSTYIIQVTPTEVKTGRNVFDYTATINHPERLFHLTMTLRNRSAGAHVKLLITKLEIDGVDYYDIVEPLQNNNPEALRIGDLTINTLDNKIEATQLEVGAIEAGDSSNVITLKSTSADSVALEGSGTLESQWRLADDAGMTSAFSENGQVETLTFTQNYDGVIINQGLAIISDVNGASETSITLKSTSTASDTQPFHGIGIGRLVSTPPLGSTPDDLFEDWFMLYKIKGNNKNPTKLGSPLRPSVRDETDGKARDLAWYPINNTYQIRLNVEGGRAYVGAVKTSGVNTFPTYWYSADLTLSPGAWVVFYYGAVPGTLSTRVHHTADSKDIIIAGWPINETLTRLSASKPLLSETLTLPEDELTLEVPITIVEKNSCSLPSFTKDGDQTFRKTIINNWSSPEFKGLATDDPGQSLLLAVFDGANTSSNINLTGGNTIVHKPADNNRGSSYSEPIDFNIADYKLKFIVTQNFSGNALPLFGITQNAIDLKTTTQLTGTQYARFDRVTDWGQGQMIWLNHVGIVKVNEYTDPPVSILHDTGLSAVNQAGEYVEIEFKKVGEVVKMTGSIITAGGSFSVTQLESLGMVNSLALGEYYIIIADGSTTSSAMYGKVEITRLPRNPEDLRGIGVADTVYTEEGDLWAVGGIETANGEVVGNLAKFTQGDWEPINLGDGPSFSFGIGTPQVLFWDDRKLYIGGDHANVSIGGTSSATHGWSIYDEQNDNWTLANQNMIGAIKTINKVGDVLYLAGSFTTVHNNAATRLAEYDQGTWTRPTGFNATVLCSTQIGEVIYYGGQFTQSTTGTSLNHVCEYLYNKGGNGAFFPLGLGVNGYVYAMATSGTDLYLGGAFTQAQTSTKVIPTTYFTKFDTLTGNYYPYTGLDGAVRSIRVLGDDLVLIGGDFTTPSNKLCLLKGRQFKRLTGITETPIVKPYGDNSVIFSPSIDGLIKSVSSNVDVSFPDGHVELLSLNEKKDYIAVNTDTWM